MKLNLECGNDIRSGYVNITSAPIDVEGLPENSNVIMGRPDQLDPVLKGAQASEINFAPPLNVFQPDVLFGIMNTWTQNLKTGGLLSFYFMDIRRIGLQAYSGEVSLAELHQWIFGEGGHFHTILDLNTIKQVAEQLSWTIESVSNQGNVVAVTIRK